MINELKFNEISNTLSTNPSLQSDLVLFLLKNLEKFGDPETDIRACLNYILTPEKGGYVFTATDNNNHLKSVSFVTKTNMGQFVPEYLLVYIATCPSLRGQGVGTTLMSYIQKGLKSPIALHVEHDNPAIHLYEKLGFTSKYKEMRWYPHG